MPGKFPINIGSRFSSKVLRLLPWILFSVLLIGDFLGWRDAQDLTHQLILSQTSNTAEEVAKRIDVYIRERVNSLALLANLWRESSDRRSSEPFLKYAQRIVDQSPSYDVIVYLDGESMPMVSSPLGRNEALIGLDLRSRPLDQDLLDKVRASLSILSPAPIAHLTGGHGVALWFPILVPDGDDVTMKGVIAGTMNLTNVIDQAVRPNNRKDFRIKVEVEGRRIFDSSPTEIPENEENWSAGFYGYNLSVFDMNWKLSVHPKGNGAWLELSMSNMTRFGVQALLSALASFLLAWALGMLGRVQQKGLELKQSQQRYQTLVDSATDAIIVFEADGRLLDINRAGCEMLGIGKEDLSRRTLTDIISPDHYQSFKENLAEIAQNQRVFFETYQITGAGLTIPVELSARLIEYEGHPAILGLARDISLRKEAIRALEESEQRFRATFELAAVGMAQVSPGGRFLRVNRKFLDILGYEETEILGLNLLEVTHPEDCSITREVIHRALTGEQEMISREKRYLHKNGTTIWVDMFSSLVLSAEGIPLYFIDAVNDSTERKRTEEALLKSEENLKITMDSIGEAVIAADAEGRVTRMNPVAESITGWSSREALTQPLEKVFVTVDAKSGQPVTEMVMGALKNGQVPDKGKPTILISRQGLERQIDHSAAPIRDADGRIVGGVLVFRDVAEKNRLEKQLRQAQKMEAIGTLAGGIAHDFNNILGSILGYTQMALLDTQEGRKTKRRLQEIFKAATLAKDLVRQILTFSRHSEQDLRPINIAPIIKETIKLLRSSLPSTIEIRQELDPSIGQIMADPIQIQQVIMNLCTNSAQAMVSRRGLLRIALTIVEDYSGPQPEPDNNGPAKWAKLTVSDSGLGIDPKIKDRIFEPYFTTKEVGEGTGLGLSVVHGIVQSHGGRIEIKSQIGVGTTVNIFLPVVINPSEVIRQLPVDLPTGHESILMIDDDRSFLDINAEMLEYLGYQVEKVYNAPEAIEKFLASPDRYHLIITDQIMPQLTGVDLVREFKKVRPKIPTLITTGNDHDLNFDQLLQLGIKGIMIKPLIMEELSIMVRRALET
ncbi:MAG: PAS domain S-box protein [Deltaproteobacteria bacterium]|nr:PAS domain S-box protein [Deltaproteobacteria bacterium]